DAPGCRRKAAAGEMRPVSAAIARAVESRPGPVRGRIDVPGRASGLPEGREDDVRVAGVEHHFDGAGVAVRPQDLRPARSAVARLEEAALCVGAVRGPERRDVDDVGAARVPLDAADLLRVAQAHEAPRLAAVARAIHAPTLGDVRAHVGLAGAGVDYLGVR